jgi:hypothetical protein
MTRSALAISALLASLSCASCGLFLDDFSKGEASGGDGGSDTDSESTTGDTPCDGVDLAVTPCCNLEDSCLYSYFDFCDCPTCPWDLIDCADGGAGDAGADTDTESGASASRLWDLAQQRAGS